jgi:hypothetical protein
MTDDNVTTFFGPKSENLLSENALTELKYLLGFMYTIRKYEDLKKLWGCCCVLLKNPFICTETNKVRNKISLRKFRPVDDDLEVAVSLQSSY